MMDNPVDGLGDSAAPVRILSPAPGDQSESSITLREEQQAGAAERAKAYAGSLADQTRARKIAPNEIDEGRMRFTRPEDGLGLERILGRSDLVPINYLEFGQRAARTVCHIQIRLPNGAMVGHATGFLVAPCLLLTNNHVFPTAQMATRSLAEFDFEDDIAFNPRPTKLFRLRPEELFFTSRTLDFSFVAVAPTANDGTPLSTYGNLRLAGDPDKLMNGEYVSIIQHPQGNSKQAALRENQVIWGDANFLHYETDTQPGSSGAPVFNDQWYVVALHHAGVPRTDAAGNTLKTDGQPLQQGEPEDLVDWIANEGVRISRIFRALAESGDAAAAAALARLRSVAGGPLVSPIFMPPSAAVPAGTATSSSTGALAIPAPPAATLKPMADAVLPHVAASQPSKVIDSTAIAVGPMTANAIGSALPRSMAPAIPAAVAGAMAAASLPEARVITPPASDAALYTDRGGYREDFLGAAAGMRVPLPRVGEREQLLLYANFSIIFSLDRRLARMTAVNIDGPSWQSIPRRRPDTWSYDPRLDVAAQAGRTLYDGTRFDYGHLVRRQDACSGDVAAEAERDTFHLTNAAPQDHALNIGPWNNLEDHVLDTIRMTRTRVTVLTGPVFRAGDPMARGVLIPQDFFKIAVYADDGGALAAAGWVQHQPDGTAGEEVAPQFLGRFPMWQLPIARIAEMTGLDLGPLVAADALASLRGQEASMGMTALPIASADDLVL
ncbi:MAG: DNA/RNA non-specific endonuclease [Rhodospirillales bacterium]|nr:DNA/RNA non-specific endonuclease [Rhodospirillales bacterium]